MNKQAKTLFALLFVGLLVTGCNNSQSSTISTSISDATQKTISIHFDSETCSKVDFYFFNQNKDIPYIEIKNSVDSLLDLKNYSISQKDSAFTITNKITNSNAVLNFNGVVMYEDVLKFQSSNLMPDECYLDEFANDVIKCQKISSLSSYTKPAEYKVDISKYGFKPSLYEGKYYLPINVLNTLICPDFGSYYYAGNEEIYLVKEGIKQSPSAKTSYTNLKTFFEHCFNIFSLSTELHFGLKGYSRTPRVNSKELKYLSNGVIESFAPYKEKIINSKDLGEFDTNFSRMFNETMTDGGHTALYTPSLGNNTIKELPSSEEDKYLTNLADQGKTARVNSADKESFDYTTYVYDTDKDNKFDIGYITFDRFEVDTKAEAPAIQKIFRGKEGANATLNKNDTDNYDSSNYDIKDIVIDLSLNTGGAIPAFGYVLSWICGGIAQVNLKSTSGKALSSYAYNFDVNGDSVYDKKDYLPNDVNVYILMSPVTYSAANMLAFYAKQYNLRNPQSRQIRFIGQQSGGGACSVTEDCYLPTGLQYRLASNNVYVDPNNNNLCCENGVKPDSGLAISDINNLFNRTGTNGVNQLVVSKR